MALRKCDGCGEPAVALVKGQDGHGQLCLRCLDASEARVERYVCSVQGCQEPPEFLVTTDDGQLRTLFLCDGHFESEAPMGCSYLPLPRWLTTDDDIAIDENCVSFENEFPKRE